MKRKRRLKIGGDVWKNQFETVREQVGIAHKACRLILNVVEKNKDIPFSAAISIYVGRLALAMTDILKAVDQIEKIGKDFKEEQDQQEPLDELDEIARRAIARRPYEDVEDE